MNPMQVASDMAAVENAGVIAAAVGWLFTHTGTMLVGLLFGLFFMWLMWRKRVQPILFPFLDELVVAAKTLKDDLQRHQAGDPLGPMHLVMLGCITIALAVFSGFCITAVSTIISALATPHG